MAPHKSSALGPAGPRSVSFPTDTDQDRPISYFTCVQQTAAIDQGVQKGLQIMKLNFQKTAKLKTVVKHPGHAMVTLTQ